MPASSQQSRDNSTVVGRRDSGRLRTGRDGRWVLLISSGDRHLQGLGSPGKAVLTGWSGTEPTGHNLPDPGTWDGCPSWEGQDLSAKLFWAKGTPG